MMRPTPKQKAPRLNFPLIDGEKWSLEEQKSENFTLIVFYRGLHCPLCKKYLETLESLLPEFESRGVKVVAVSMDTKKRASFSRQNWEIFNLHLGYNLSEEMAKNWGLYLSQGVKQGEPEVFSEPGLFLIDNKKHVYYVGINSNPWGRPYLPTFIKAVDYIISSEYPARGEIL